MTTETQDGIIQSVHNGVGATISIPDGDGEVVIFVAVSPDKHGGGGGHLAVPEGFEVLCPDDLSEPDTWFAGPVTEWMPYIRVVLVDHPDEQAEVTFGGKITSWIALRFHDDLDAEFKDTMIADFGTDIPKAAQPGMALHAVATLNPVAFSVDKLDDVVAQTANMIITFNSPGQPSEPSHWTAIAVHFEEAHIPISHEDLTATINAWATTAPTVLPTPSPTVLPPIVSESLGDVVIDLTDPDRFTRVRLATPDQDIVIQVIPK